MSVILTLGEARVAAVVGCERQLRAIYAGQKDRAGFRSHEAWAVHVEAAGAELAFAKFLGVYWTASGDGRPTPAPDAGEWFVRSTRYSNGDLILRGSDRPGRYALVVGAVPRFRVVGWAAWPEAQQDRYLDAPDPDRPPCWAIPQRALFPFAEQPERTDAR